MHPLTAQRLDLWRLKNFDGRRLPSAEDTYLLHVVAKENPNDERLIAMAEVRDATPLTNAAGEVIGFPTVERLLTACIDSLRRARAQLGGGRRLDHNRIFLYAWPSIELPLSQLATLARNVAPLTVGAGLDADRDPGPAAGGAGRGAPGRGAALLEQPRHRRRAAGDRPADRADAPAGRLHAEGAPVAGPRSRLPVRAGAARGRTAGHASSSTTWTPTAGWRRSTGRRAPTRPASSWAW